MLEQLSEAEPYLRPSANSSMLLWSTERNSSAVVCVAGVQALLEVVNDLFEEQTDLEKIVRKIMHRAQTLLKCERCSVQLLEDIESPVLFLCHVHLPQSLHAFAAG